MPMLHPPFHNFLLILLYYDIVGISKIFSAFSSLCHYVIFFPSFLSILSIFPMFLRQKGERTIG